MSILNNIYPLLVTNPPVAVLCNGGHITECFQDDALVAARFRHLLLDGFGALRDYVFYRAFRDDITLSARQTS